MHSSVLDPKIKTLAVKYCVSMESGKVWYLEGHFFLFFIFFETTHFTFWRWLKKKDAMFNYELSSSRAHQDVYHTNLTCWYDKHYTLVQTVLSTLMGKTLFILFRATWYSGKPYKISPLCIVAYKYWDVSWYAKILLVYESPCTRNLFQ